MRTVVSTYLSAVSVSGCLFFSFAGFQNRIQFIFCESVFRLFFSQLFGGLQPLCYFRLVVDLNFNDPLGIIRQKLGQGICNSNSIVTGGNMFRVRKA